MENPFKDGLVYTQCKVTDGGIVSKWTVLTTCSIDLPTKPPTPSTLSPLPSPLLPSPSTYTSRALWGDHPSTHRGTSQLKESQKKKKERNKRDKEKKEKKIHYYCIIVVLLCFLSADSPLMLGFRYDPASLSEAAAVYVAVAVLLTSSVAYIAFSIRV